MQYHLHHISVGQKEVTGPSPMIRMGTTQGESSLESTTPGPQRRYAGGGLAPTVTCGQAFRCLGFPRYHTRGWAICSGRSGLGSQSSRLAIASSLGPRPGRWIGHCLPVPRAHQPSRKAPAQGNSEQLGCQGLSFGDKSGSPQPSLMCSRQVHYCLITKCRPKAIYSAFSPETHLFILHFR